MNSNFKRSIALVLCIVLILPSLVFGQEKNNDINGHWAEKEITQWIEKGIVSGYPDGSFKPNKPIKRAEFITMVNASFGFDELEEINFDDVNSSDWFALEISKAVKAGYINGYENNTVRPNNNISRQEVAVILSSILNEDKGEIDLDVFNDSGKIADWSLDAVKLSIEKGLMKGYPDSTFKPNADITRAEAVVTLDRAIKSEITVLDEAGTYELGQVTGNVLIDAEDVILKDTVVEGNLIISEKVGEGDASLDNVTVEGETIIKGGGENSIIIINSKLNKVTVNKSNGKIRIVAQGNTDVDEVNLESGAKIEEEETEGEGFGYIVISDKMLEDSEVILSGDFKEVKVDSKKSKIKVEKGTIENIEVSEKSEDTIIETSEETNIKNIEISSKTEVKGKGKIEKASIKSNDVKIEQKPEETELDKDIEEAEVGGEKVKPEDEEDDNTSSAPRGSNSSDDDTSDDNDDSNDGNNSSEPEDILVERIVIKDVFGQDATEFTTELTLGREESMDFGYEIYPSNATNKSVRWESSNEEVATVDEDGKVIAVGIGEATITVKAQDDSDVRESLNIRVNRIENIKPIQGTVGVGGNYELPSKVDAIMSNGEIANYEVEWSNIEVNTSEVGEFTFEGSVEGYDEKVMLILNVTENSIQILDVTPETGSTIEEDGKLISATLEYETVGDAVYNSVYTAVLEIGGDNGTYTIGEVELDSSNGEVVIEGNVSKEDVEEYKNEDNKVYLYTGIRNENNEFGKTYQEDYDYYYIVEEDILAERIVPRDAFGEDATEFTTELTLGREEESMDFGYEIYPSNTTNKSVRWESSNEEVATVDENGVVTATGVGKATITISTEDGSDLSTTFDIEVEKYVEVTSNEELEEALKDSYVSEIGLNGTFDGFRVDRDNISIIGGTIKTTDVEGTNAGVYISGASNVNIEDVTFEGQGEKSIAVVTVYNINSDEIEIKNNTFNNLHIGVYFNLGTFGEISNNTFEDIDYAAIGLDTGSKEIIVEENEMINSNIGIEIFGDNVEYNRNSYNNVAIKIMDISNEKAEVSTQQGLEKALTDKRINTIGLNGTFDGFRVDRDNISIIGGTIIPSDILGEKAGIYVNGSKNISISDVNFEGTTAERENGVLTTSESTNLKVENNIFSNLNMGVYLNPYASGEIVGNEFNIMDYCAIGIDTDEGVKIQNNSINTSKIGIEIFKRGVTYLENQYTDVTTNIVDNTKANVTTQEELKAAISEEKDVILQTDIVVDETIEIYNDNLVIDGDNNILEHKNIGGGKSVLKITGDNVEVKNIRFENIDDSNTVPFEVLIEGENALVQGNEFVRQTVVEKGTGAWGNPAINFKNNVTIKDNFIDFGAIGGSISASDDVEISGNTIEEAITEGIWIVVQGNKDESSISTTAKELAENNMINDYGEFKTKIIYNNRIYTEPDLSKDYEGEEVEKYIVSENFNTYKGISYSGVNVGWRLEDLNLNEVTKMEISILDENGNTIATNISTDKILDLNTKIFSTPFDIEGDYDDEYWTMGEWTAEKDIKPSVANIKIYDRLGNTYTIKNNNLVEPNGWTWEKLFSLNYTITLGDESEESIIVQFGNEGITPPLFEASNGTYEFRLVYDDNQSLDLRTWYENNKKPSEPIPNWYTYLLNTVPENEGDTSINPMFNIVKDDQGWRIQDGTKLESGNTDLANKGMIIPNNFPKDKYIFTGVIDGVEITVEIIVE